MCFIVLRRASIEGKEGKSRRASSSRSLGLPLDHTRSMSLDLGNQSFTQAAAAAAAAATAAIGEGKAGGQHAHASAFPGAGGGAKTVKFANMDKVRLFFSTFWVAVACVGVRWRMINMHANLNSLL